MGLDYFSWIDDTDCFYKMAWVTNTWSWNLIIQRKGGSIGTIGNSGLGWGSSGSGSTDSLDGWITTHFFQVFSQNYNNSNCTLGKIHSNTLSDYVTEFNPNKMYHELDRKTVEQWVLIGDPSLKIGGYP